MCEWLTSCGSKQGRADVILNGRMFQKNPGLVWKFADDLGVELHHTGQIGWGFSGRAKILLGSRA